MAESDYWEQFQHLYIEVEDALAIFHTYEEINRIAVERESAFEALNRDALFWKITIYSLQTSLFIILARIFDSGDSAHSIHRLINVTLDQPELFSKDALAARKMGSGSKPDWLDDYMVGVWAPNGADDLRHLKKALKPYTRKFEQVYRPIRNSYFAHRSLIKDEAISKLFRQTNRTELAEILDFLHDLMNAIQELYLNGHKPELGNRAEFHERYNQKIKDEGGNVLSTIVASILEAQKE